MGQAASNLDLYIKRLRKKRIVTDEQEDEGDAVLDEEARVKIESWIDSYKKYQDDFRLDAPVDWTRWKRDAEGNWKAIKGIDGSASDDTDVGNRRRTSIADELEVQEEKEYEFEPLQARDQEGRVTCCGTPVIQWKKKSVPLVSIDRSQQMLEDLPEDISNFGSQLTSLDLCQNFINALPGEEIAQLVGLGRLHLDNNLMTDLPQELQFCTMLQDLSVHHNSLQSLPDNFGHMWHLKWINLQANKLSVLPETLSYLDSLEILRIAENKFTGVPLPGGLAQFPRLTKLTLHMNRIKNIPESVFETDSNSLKELTLHQTGLESLPMSLLRLTALEVLTLQQNELQKLPNGIGLLRNLRNLEVQFNKLKVIPESLGSIANLRTFIANNNSIDMIPATIGNVPMLHTIALHSNRISTLPPDLNKLQFVQCLTFHNNRLSKIDDSTFRGLRMLQKLTLAQNNLTSLPASLMNLRSIDVLDCDDNPLDANSLPDQMQQVFTKLNGRLPRSTTHTTEVHSIPSEKPTRTTKKSLAPAPTTEEANAVGPVESPLESLQLDRAPLNEQKQVEMASRVGMSEAEGDNKSLTGFSMEGSVAGSSMEDSSRGSSKGSFKTIKERKEAFERFSNDKDLDKMGVAGARPKNSDVKRISSSSPEEAETETSSKKSFARPTSNASQRAQQGGTVLRRSYTLSNKVAPKGQSAVAKRVAELNA